MNRMKENGRRPRRDDCFPYGSGVKYLAQSVDNNITWS